MKGAAPDNGTRNNLRLCTVSRKRYRPHAGHLHNRVANCGKVANARQGRNRGILRALKRATQ